MGKKKYSCSSSSSDCKCGNCSSLSSSFGSCSLSSSSSSCSSSSGSNYGYCCNKYPKCKGSCYNKCAPIYYPNNCVGRIPCPPYSPYPCPTSPCAPTYTVNTSIGTTAITLAYTSPTVNVFNTNAGAFSVTLPTISTLSPCNYTKQFVIANQSGIANALTISPAAGDSIITGSISLTAGQTATLYAVYVAGGASFWVAQI
jgi:hypothetical protein